MDKVHDTYFLVNLVDNDFPKGSCLWNVLEDMFSRRKLNSKLPEPPTLEKVMNTLSYTKVLEKDDA